MIKVAIPRKIRRRLKARHRNAKHHIIGFVCRGRACCSNCGFLYLLESVWFVFSSGVCGFVARFCTIIWSKEANSASLEDEAWVGVDAWATAAEVGDGLVVGRAAPLDGELAGGAMEVGGDGGGGGGGGYRRGIWTKAEWESSNSKRKMKVDIFTKLFIWINC